MAYIAKFKSHRVYGLLKHNNRKKDDGQHHTNEEIDNERTYLNYSYKKGSYDDMKKRLDEVYHLDRDNLVVLAEVVVTLPKDVKPEDERKFFDSVYEFYKNDFGEENIINAVVHKDETTPHIHFDFVPVKKIDRDDMTDLMKSRLKVYEEKHGHVEYALNAKEVIDYVYLANMHTRLYEHVANDLGYECEILNGATDKGNRTVLQMKNEKLTRELEAKQSKVELLSKNISLLDKGIKANGMDEKYFDAHQLFTLIDRYKYENEALKDLCYQNGLTLPKEDLKQIYDFQKNTGSHFTYMAGSFTPKGTTVIETFKDVERRLPQRQLIESNPKLEEIVQVIRPQQLYVTKDKDYIFFPTDDIEDTFKCLLKLKEKEHEFTHITFPQISNDTFHIAEAILRECSFETEFYLEEKKTRESLMRERMLLRREESKN